VESSNLGFAQAVIDNLESAAFGLKMVYSRTVVVVAVVPGKMVLD
jgi:hypothetical protein